MRALALGGQSFGRLTVLSESGRSRNGKVTWLCRCECGSECVVDGTSLKNGNTRSCGCLHVDTITSHGHSTRRNGRTKEFRAWIAMIDRCTNPNSQRFDRYGGRGIAVCERWASFLAFLDDMGPSPAGTSLDRIDNDGNYTPSNCRWASRLIQARNTSINRLLTAGGRTICVSEWALITGIPIGTINKRLKLGWPDAQILEFVPRNRHRLRSPEGRYLQTPK